MFVSKLSLCRKQYEINEVPLLALKQILPLHFIEVDFPRHPIRLLFHISSLVCGHNEVYKEAQRLRRRDPLCTFQCAVT